MPVTSAQVSANQKAAAKLGFSIPGVGGGSSSSSSSSGKDTLPAGVAYQTYNSDGSVNKSYDNSQYSSFKANEISSGRDTPVGVGGTITGASIAPATSMVLPTPTPLGKDGTNAMNLVGGLVNEKTEAPASTPAPASSPLTERLKAMVAPPSATDIYRNLEQESQLEQKRQLKNNYQGQLNAIVAQAQTDKLSLVGQGRGVTEAIIGGQQAQIDREAAIRSLPIAAQLTAAQGDLEAAQTHVDTYFKLLSQDAQNKFEYKNKVADIVYNYATDQQKLALDAKNRLDDRSFSMYKENLDFSKSLALKAIESGQSNLLPGIFAQDATSKDFMKNISSNASKIVPKQSGRGMTDGQRTRSENDDIAQVIVEFQTKIAGGWAGANPDAYSHYKTQLINTHGWGAALKLDKDMAELGITVDRVNIK